MRATIFLLFIIIALLFCVCYAEGDSCSGSPAILDSFTKRDAQECRSCPQQPRYCCNSPDKCCSAHSSRSDPLFCCGFNRTCCGAALGEYCCPSDMYCNVQGDGCCASTSVACPMSGCCDRVFPVCCGELCCRPKRNCCLWPPQNPRVNSSACCAPEDTCCNGRCCATESSETCCVNKDPQKQGSCCRKGEQCCGGDCCAEDQQCCGDICCSLSEECCKEGCCPKKNKNTGKIIGAVIGTLGGLAAIGIAIAVYMCARKRRIAKQVNVPTTGKVQK